MRRIILLASVCLLAACSSTRQQGYFHPTFEKSGVTVVPVAVNAPAQIPSESQTLVASKSNEVVSSSESTPSATTLESVRRTYLQMSKAEKKELRRQLKAEIKSYVKDQKSKVAPAKQANGAMDHDLKLAIIFGAVGVVGLIIGGNAFWIIGGIALLIGVVFFVKWIIRQ